MFRLSRKDQLYHLAAGPGENLNNLSGQSYETLDLVSELDLRSNRN